MMCPFQGLSELQKNKLLKKLESHIYKYQKNEEILPTLKNTDCICILLEGTAQISILNYLGEETILEELEKDSVFGSTISNINDIECQIKATEACVILMIDYVKLIRQENCNYPYFNQFLLNLFQIINVKFRDLNDRIQIITKKSIRDKLLAFFDNEYRKTRSQRIYLSSNFKNLADYLSVNRSAMFRELKSLKEEKFITVDRNRITLLYVPQI